MDTEKIITGENISVAEKPQEQGIAKKETWTERAEQRKNSINKSLNEAIQINDGQKLNRLNSTTEKSINHRYIIDSKAIKNTFGKKYGFNVDNFISAVAKKDIEKSIYVKITAVNDLRKFAKENLKLFL